MISYRISRSRDQSGQALVEFTFVAIILLVMLFGMIDFCRAISTRQVLINLSREGSNQAARGAGDTPDAAISNAITAVISAANPLDIKAHGQVIISAVINSSGVYRVTNQISEGKLTQLSKIGVVNATGNGVSGAVTMPVVSTDPDTMPQPGQTVFVTEVFYTFTPTTAIGNLINISMTNAPLYDVAYF